MARLASAADFYAQWDPDGNKVPGTGNLYDEYRRYPFFAFRADLIASRFLPSIGKVVVFGCGFGYLVDELVQRGFDAWGVEAADWARTKAAEVLPFASANRVVLANMVNRSALAAVRTAAGLTGNQRFAVGISEDVLPVCTDVAEAQLGLAEARRIVSTTTGRMVHFITCAKPETVGDLDHRLPGLLWLSRTQWRGIIGPDDICVDCEGPGAGVEF